MLVNHSIPSVLSQICAFASLKSLHKPRKSLSVAFRYLSPICVKDQLKPFLLLQRLFRKFHLNLLIPPLKTYITAIWHYLQCWSVLLFHPQCYILLLFVSLYFNTQIVRSTKAGNKNPRPYKSRYTKATIAQMLIKWYWYCT